MGSGKRSGVESFLSELSSKGSMASGSGVRPPQRVKSARLHGWGFVVLPKPMVVTSETWSSSRRIHSGSRRRFEPATDDDEADERRWSGGGAVHRDVSEWGLSVRMLSGVNEA